MIHESSPHRLEARDGTRIAWYPHGPVAGAKTRIVLTNGLSTTPNFWKHLVSVLAQEHRVVHWDYRGHGASDAARSGEYAIDAHADDLLRVSDASGGDGAVHVAFSMGVTVLLEAIRKRASLARALVLIAGGADHPYASSALLRMPGARAALRSALGAVAPLVPQTSAIARRVAASRAIFPLSQALGAIGRDAPRDDLEHFFRSVGAMDLRAYWESMRSLMEAHASDVLPTIRVPVLVIAPERDVMATRADLEALRDGIPDAEWMLVERTGHAILLEAGDVVAERVKAFVERVG